MVRKQKYSTTRDFIIVLKTISFHVFFCSLSESNKDLNLSFEDNPPTEFKAPKLNLIECQHPYNRSLPNIQVSNKYLCVYCIIVIVLIDIMNFSQLIEEMAHYVKNVHGVNDDTVQAALEICLLMNPDNLDHMENLLNYTIKVNSDVSYVLGRLQDIAEVLVIIINFIHFSL